MIEFRPDSTPAERAVIIAKTNHGRDMKYLLTRVSDRLGKAKTPDLPNDDLCLLDEVETAVNEAIEKLSYWLDDHDDENE